jgi:predicted extracellular nuclease
VIRDNDFDSHVISNGGPLNVPAGGFLVLGINGDPVTNGGVAVDYEYGSGFFLSNSSDELVLLDGSLTEIDRVEWDNGATFPDPNGASMSLINPTLDNNAGANWCTASTPFGDGDLGTPGAVNDCSTGGAVVINEIMQNPSAVSDSNGEWFEVHNPTIRDNDFDSHVISNGGPLNVPAGGFLVLGINGDPVTNGGVAVDYEYGSGFFLSNGSDELVLLDGSLVEIDRVEWDNGATFPDPNGASMSLIDPTLDNNVGENWCTASTPFGDGDLGTPGAVNVCPVAPPFGNCQDPATFIHDVQGDGPSSPLDGTTGLVLEAVVVGDFEDTATELGGFFIQEEDADADANPMTSEGIFIRNSGFGPGVSVGDRVRVQGDVREFFSLTELNNIINLAVCGTVALPTPAMISLPVSAVADFETWEGMSVVMQDTLFVSGNFNQGRFGEVDLSVGAPLDNPTNVVAPGAPALALQDLNRRSRIQLDDGSNVQNPLPLPPYLGDGNTLRTGDTTAAGLTAVLSFSFGAYELHPVAPVSFTRVNDRPGPPDVGGEIRVASFNVLNYFTTLDDSGPICGPSANQGCRGADNALEFMQQRDKLISAITRLDADVVGLIELENNAFDDPIADLVDGLNAATGAGTYDYIPTGPIGSDAIRVGLIYQPSAVSPLNPFAVLDSSVDPLFNDDRNRPVLAQSFSENSTGEVFTVAVNHLKSKGSPCDDIGDPDTGDGQGNCNGVRTAAAVALVDWLATDPTGSDSGNFLILGDLNAYSQEDPVTAIESAGYIDLIETLVGTGFADGAYSFNFSSESGALDHALSSPDMLTNVTGAAIWHINADEPRALDYNDFNQPLLFNPDEFRSSDHDPVVVGLFADSDGDGVLDVVDNCPDTAIPESVPTTGQLNPNHWALTDGDTMFDTVTTGKGKGPNRSYSTADTAGCSCEQIIEAQGLGNGLGKHGCSIGVMDNWVELVTP